MTFLRKYRAALKELLIAPLVFRAALPELEGLSQVSVEGMRDLARFGGFADGAIRTAMSRLREANDIERLPGSGTARYRLGPLGRSIAQAVGGQFERPDGYILAVFSFAADDARERQIVRTALKSHGFAKLAQNVYISGLFDTTALEAIIAAHGLAEHLFLFRCADARDTERDARLRTLFDIKRRAAVLLRFDADLHGFLDERGIDGDEFARRYLAAAPIHYRITFIDEPPVPARCLPADYPLARLLPYVQPDKRRMRALVRYHQRINAEKPE
jgi:DNA-binding transcriptional regulator PaaX